MEVVKQINVDLYIKFAQLDFSFLNRSFIKQLEIQNPKNAM